MKVFALFFVFALVACGSINVPSPASSSSATDTGTGTDTATNIVPPTVPARTATVPTAGPTLTNGATASASCTAVASAGANGAASAVALPPQLAYSSGPLSWKDAMAQAPAGYHVPSRGELVTLSDAGTFGEKAGVWWTSSEGQDHASAWLYSPDAGVLAANDKSTEAKAVYVEGISL